MHHPRKPESQINVDSLDAQKKIRPGRGGGGRPDLASLALDVLHVNVLDVVRAAESP